MSKYDFEDFLKRKFNDNPQAVLTRYKYNSVDEIMERIDSNSDGDIDELRDIINEIVLWKLNRMVFVENSTLLELKDISIIETPEDVIRKDKDKVKSLLTHLLESKGVRLPMASTFMHFFNPTVFPIIDQRAYRVIYKKDYKDPYSIKEKVNTYIDYLQECLNYYNVYLKDKIPFSEIDKYLYQLDKEIGNGVKM